MTTPSKAALATTSGTPSLEQSRPPTATPRTLSPLTLALVVLALIVVVAMLALGATLLQQIGEIEDNQQLSANLVDFSERPYTAVQRDVLRLAVLIEDENSEINDVRNLRAIITNHMTGLTAPVQVRVRSAEVNAATIALLTRWASDTQNAITDFIGAPVRDEAERARVIAALQSFERDLNAISVQNELDRQQAAAELDSSTIDVLDTMRNVLAGLGATGALLMLFGAGVALSIARSTQRVIRLNNVLDQRVRERTRDLQTATDVSRQITTLLNIDELVKQVAAETVKRYELDALLVGLVDEDTQQIKIVASSDKQGNSLRFGGDAPQIALEARPSVIARAARERTSLVVPDTTTSLDYLSLSGLPDIRSEAVIPMVVGDRTVGVLDLYSKDPARFSPPVVNALGIVANQTAIAVQNARLYTEATHARQEAETANKAKSQFLAAMSHELRTPMNSVLNFTQFVSSGMLGEVNDEQKDALDKGYASGEHLLNLINDVLDISKIESDALQLYVERDIEVQQIMQAVADTAESMLKGQSVEFSIEKPEKLPLLLGDKQRIRQIVLNLVSNACKFTKEGHIKVKLSQPDAAHLTISVTDTGPGIPKDQHDKIFELFSQTKVGLRRGGGTGLGLPIARRLAAAHEGTLTVDSEPGKGATFTLRLPIKPASLEKILLAQEAELE